MKNYFLYGLLTVAMGIPHSVRADVPRKLAGFVLGGRMDDFRALMDKDTVLPNRYLESMKEVEAKDILGYKTGLIAYSTCIKPSRIVRLKFKYADNSKALFDELLERYEAHLGKPDGCRGDPFHIVIAWKWSFTDSGGTHISLILQHNIRDEEVKAGNAVKMTKRNLMFEEERCFEKNQSGRTGPPEFTFRDLDSVNWKPLIPRYDEFGTLHSQ